MALRLGFIGIVTRDMSASLAFYRLLGAPVPDGSDESHVDTRLEDGIVLAWDTIDLIRSLDPVAKIQRDDFRSRYLNFFEATKDSNASQVFSKNALCLLLMEFLPSFQTFSMGFLSGL